MSNLETNLEQILQEKQAKIIPGNIKKDVQIFEIVGTYEGLDTSDANAVDSDIISGKTAYVNGQKITGTMETRGGLVPVYWVDEIDSNRMRIEDVRLDANNGGNLDLQLKFYAKIAQYGSSGYELLLPYSKLTPIIDLTPEKIVAGNTILGVEGTYEGDNISEYFNTQPTSSSNLVKNLITKLPNIDMNSITSLNTTFQDCINLTEISLSNTSSVINMNSTFKNCTSLTTVPQFDTSKVIYMNSMFEGCTSLTTVPQFDTSKVIYMGSMFKNCTSLTTIPQFDTSRVTDITSMFEGCTSLTTVPLLDTSSMNNQRTYRLFYNCISLTSVPQLDTSRMSSLESMFEGCTNLVDIPVFNTSNVLIMTNTFKNCLALSNDSLNNILQMCANVYENYPSDKTLKNIGLSETQAQTCTTLSNYEAFTSAGWTTGY